jgi:hypothetical protein
MCYDIVIICRSSSVTPLCLVFLVSLGYLWTFTDTAYSSVARSERNNRGKRRRGIEGERAGVGRVGGVIKKKIESNKKRSQRS